MSTLLEQASLVMIPSGYKEDIVYSQIPTSGAGDLSFTRASNGTRVNSAGLVEVCPWNLVEQSETFNTGWTINSGATVTSNSETAPNGTLTADTLNASANIYSGIYQSLGSLPTNAYTYSIYGKAGTNNYLYLLGQGNGGERAFFNLNTGVVGATQNIDSASIESVGNGWYRCQIQKTGTGVEMFAGSSNIENVTPTASGTVFIWGAQTNIGSTANPYFPTTDRLNVPRLTYQNGGGGCPSLLLEKQSTNLVQYSEQFDNAAWTKGAATITANATTSPDGTQNADAMVDTATDAEHNINQSTTITSNVASTFSVYLKSGTQPFAMLRHFGAASEQYFCVVVNLNTGVITKTQAGTSTSATSSSITNVGNGWYRVTATCSFASTNAVPILQLVNSATPTIGIYGDYSYTGNGTNSIFAWGAQVEQSSYPTSYIPTTSASATRVADACFKTGISSLIGQTEGVVFLDFIFTNINDLQVIMSLHDNANNKRVEIWANASSLYGFIGGSSSFNIASLTATNGARYKVAVAYKSGDSAYYVNGTQIGTDSTTFTISLTSLIFDYWGGGYPPNAKVNEAIIFPTRLTNSELASLTTI
jgi:hypothetical protein